MYLKNCHTSFGVVSAVASKAAALAASILLLICIVFQGACSNASSDSAGGGFSGPAVLMNSGTSAEAVATEFLDRLAGGDTQGIVDLRITKEEFCNYAWPELPAAQDRRVECDWVWNQATIRSNAGLREVLNEHYGKRYHLRSLTFRGPDERYDSYQVLKDPILEVQDENGATQRLRLFGSMIELNGQYKLFSFVTD